MTEPDVNWDGISHEQIVAWTESGPGARVTQMLEERLKEAAKALTTTADIVNDTLQRVHGGEWSGAAATVAAQAMQVMRDFDDTMRHLGEMNNLAAFGQSDIADWAKVNVPPVVSVRAPQATGSFKDLVAATEDYQLQQQAAKDAEERARQVMRDYESMTRTRIAALPPLSLPPQVVALNNDTVTVPSGDPVDGGRAHDSSRRGGGSPDGSTPSLPQPDGRSGGPVPPMTPIPGPTMPGTPVPGTNGPGASGPATSPTGSTSSDLTSTRPSLAAGFDGGTARPISAVASGPIAGTVGAPGIAGGDGAQPHGAVVRTPGVSAPHAAAARGWSPGVAPFGTGGKPGEEKEHQARYKVPESEFFEPDNDDGLLHDPYHPGSFVAPAIIGDDDDE